MSQDEWYQFMSTHGQKECAEEAHKTVCSMCGKPFSIIDMSMGDNRFEFRVGYGSRRDTQRIRLNLCTDCFDRALDMMISMCKLNPVVEESDSGGILPG